MTAMQGSDSGWMLNFTKEIKDLNSPNLGYFSNKYTILGYIQNNTDCSIFDFIVRRAKMEAILDNLNENITIFIPSNKYLLSRYSEQNLLNIDYLIAKNIVFAHIVEKKITLEMLMNSRSHLLNTKHRVGIYKSLYTKYCTKNNIININDSQILEGNIMVQNGLIHILNNFTFTLDNY